MKLASRLLHGLCASALLLSLAACGGDDGGTTPPTGPTGPETPVTPEPPPQLRCAP